MQKLLDGFNDWLAKNPKVFAYDYQFEIQGPAKSDFALSFTDIYINMSAKNAKSRIQAMPALLNYFHSFNQGYIIQSAFHSKGDAFKKMVFQFPQGTRRFVIVLNQTIKQRLNQIINTYAEVSPKFKILGRFLLLWAHKRGILKEN